MNKTEDELKEKKVTNVEKILIKSSSIGLLLFLYLLLAIGALIYLLISNNPEVIKLEPDTLKLFHQFMNVIAISLIPFLFGMLGAVTRILISGIRTLNGYIGIIIASGLMSFFSWISIKSGIFVALILPQMKTDLVKSSTEITSEHDFYSIILVSVLVGMFASNIYIMINKKVEELVHDKKSYKKKDI